jgi:hypothetical protein
LTLNNQPAAFPKTSTTLSSVPRSSVSRSKRDAVHGSQNNQETTMTTKTETIRALNDDLRQNLTAMARVS